MYKIFFKDRVIFLVRDPELLISEDFNSVLKYANPGELKVFINNFLESDSIQRAMVYYHNVDKLLQYFSKCFININAAGGLVWNGNYSEFIGMWRRGFFDLPKGKVEKDETFAKAALREVEEECGITELKIMTALTNTFHIYRINDNLILKKIRWYEMLYEGDSIPTPQISEDIESVFWMKPQDIHKIKDKCYPSVLEIFKASKYC